MDSLFSFKDTTIVSNLVKVKTLKTLPDVLNYMSSLGWAPVSGMPPYLSASICFRREFDSSELSGH
ncbi:MAG: hypothetical protein J0H74_20995 [Chitinophagaceae bacterium]|nr:hypothetical protein [Chitinophagaceae bacterium]